MCSLPHLVRYKRIDLSPLVYTKEWESHLATMKELFISIFFFFFNQGLLHVQIKTYDRTETKKNYIYTKGHVKGDKIERTEEIKENQGSKAVRWPAAVIIENALPRTSIDFRKQIHFN